MTIISTENFQINGVIDPNNNVIDNINTLATACGCWFTFDAMEGLWSVIINRNDPSKRSFNDSNIIGGISISGTGINELYNGVSVTFPNADLLDTTDVVEYEIPTEDRYPNEQDNTLNIVMSCINNPVQAQYIGMIELKQSRLDKIISFKSDYTAIGLKAGDLIDVTAEQYGYDHKLWRITKLVEDDADDGTIQVSITAIEFDPSIYDDSGIVKKERNKATGIIPKSMNQVLTAQDTGDAIIASDQTVFRSFNYIGVVPSTPICNAFYMSIYNSAYNYVVPYTGWYRIELRTMAGEYMPIYAEGGDILTHTPPYGIGSWVAWQPLLDGNVVTTGTESGMGVFGGYYRPIVEERPATVIFPAQKGQIFNIRYFSWTNYPDHVNQQPDYPGGSYTKDTNASFKVSTLVELQHIRRDNLTI